MGKRWNKEDARLHQACEDKDYKDKYAHVTLAEEDGKPEDGEEIELRRVFTKNYKEEYYRQEDLPAGWKGRIGISFNERQND